MSWPVELDRTPCVPSACAIDPLPGVSVCAGGCVSETRADTRRLDDDCARCLRHDGMVWVAQRDAPDRQRPGPGVPGRKPWHGAAISGAHAGVDMVRGLGGPSASQLRPLAGADRAAVGRRRRPTPGGAGWGVSRNRPCAERQQRPLARDVSSGRHRRASPSWTCPRGASARTSPYPRPIDLGSRFWCAICAVAGGCSRTTSRCWNRLRNCSGVASTRFASSRSARSRVFASRTSGDWPPRRSFVRCGRRSTRTFCSTRSRPSAISSTSRRIGP